MTPSIDWLDDVSVGAWVADEQLTEHGVVGSLVPPRFDSYAAVRLSGDSAAESNPDRLLRDHLVATLRAHAGGVERCVFAFADLWGWDGLATAGHAELVDVGPLPHGPGVDDLLADLHRGAEQSTAGPSAPPTPTKLETRIRSYLLYAGSVADADAVARAGAPVAMPDLWWPDDRSWFVAADTDLDFVIVAGSDDLTTALAGEGVYVEELTERSWLV